MPPSDIKGARCPRQISREQDARVRYQGSKMLPLHNTFENWDAPQPKAIKKIVNCPRLTGTQPQTLIN